MAQSSNKAISEANLHETISCKNHNKSSIIRDESASRQNQISAYYATTGREDFDSDLKYDIEEDTYDESKEPETSNGAKEVHTYQVGEQTSLSQEDLDRLKSAKQASLNTMKNINALSNYLLGEGTLFRSPQKCEDYQAHCHGCLKAARLSTTAVTTLQEMEDNLQEDKLSNNTIQFTSRYVFAKDPEVAFPVSK